MISGLKISEFGVEFVYHVIFIKSPFASETVMFKTGLGETPTLLSMGAGFEITGAVLKVTRISTFDA